jgi:hypothetical protein
LLELYEEAEKLGVLIYVGNLPASKALCIPGYVALDHTLVGTVAEERVHTAHELGHCARNAFHTRRDPDYIIQRCENKANKWAIRKLIPKDELMDAIAHGITEAWELAEYFDVTQKFMELAMWYYKNGNLSIVRCA